MHCAQVTQFVTISCTVLLFWCPLQNGNHIYHSNALSVGLISFLANSTICLSELLLINPWSDFKNSLIEWSVHIIFTFCFIWEFLPFEDTKEQSFFGILLLSPLADIHVYMWIMASTWHCFTYYPCCVDLWRNYCPLRILRNKVMQTNSTISLSRFQQHLIGMVSTKPSFACIHCHQISDG